MAASFPSLFYFSFGASHGTMQPAADAHERDYDFIATFITKFVMEN